MDPAPPRTVFTDPDSQKTRVFVPSTVYDNPHVSSSTIRDLEGLPEPLRSAWLLGRWDVFVGQFFPEWDPAILLCPPFDMPTSWRRFGMLDYGYRDPLVYLQAAISSDRQIFVYRELVLRQAVDETQAEEIARVCGRDIPDVIVAGPDLWNTSGKGPKGQSTAETYTRVWERLRFSTRLQKGANDRLLGWRRVRQYLAPHTGGDGSRTALLQIVEGRCPELVRTLPALIFDDHRAEDCDQNGEDHAPDALRYGLMSRPAPKIQPAANPSSDYEAAAIYKKVEDRRRKARLIGREGEWEQMISSHSYEQAMRLLHPATLRGPSDR